MAYAEYKIGEYVVYGTSGVCCVEDIGIRRLSPDIPEEEYYILKPVNNTGSTVFVPVNNELLMSRMRHIFTKDEIDGIINSVRGCEMKWIDDRKIRITEFRSIINRGDRRELILLIRCILSRISFLNENKKKIASSDGDILQLAQKAVGEEFSFSLGIKMSEIPAYIEAILE